MAKEYFTKVPVDLADKIINSPAFDDYAKALTIAHLKDSADKYIDDAYEKWAQKRGKTLGPRTPYPNEQNNQYRELIHDPRGSYADQYLQDEEFLQDWWKTHSAGTLNDTLKRPEQYGYKRDDVFKTIPDLLKKTMPYIENEEPYMYKKGDRVTFLNPKARDHKGWQDEHEVLGFYKGGEVVDENTADPNNKTYDIRLKNLKTGEELNSPASYLKLFK